MNQIDLAAMQLYATDLPRRHRNKVVSWERIHEHERDYYRWVVRLLLATATGKEFTEPKRRVGVKHGFSPSGQETPEYRVWVSIKSRCFNPNLPVYADYGARGITMHEAWIKDFPAFLAHVGKRPSRAHSIDRFPNNDGNYEPGNVRWATKLEQAANRRTTAWVVVDGRRMPLSDAVRLLDLNYKAVWMRISRGATPEEAVAQVRRMSQRRRTSPCG